MTNAPILKPKWKCRYCDEKFKYMQTYFAHRKEHHYIEYRIDRSEGKDISPINLLEPIKQRMELR